MKTIWIKENPLNNIISGHKIIEGRLHNGLFKNLNLGESIIFSCKSKKCLVKIINIMRFNNFNELLSKYNIHNVLPGISTITEGVEHYNNIYSRKKILDCGVLAIHIKLISMQ